LASRANAAAILTDGRISTAKMMVAICAVMADPAPSVMWTRIADTVPATIATRARNPMPESSRSRPELNTRPMNVRWA
jgi:hypothetical protein